MNIALTCFICFSNWGTDQAIHAIVTKCPATIQYIEAQTHPSVDISLLSLVPQIETYYTYAIHPGMTRKEVGQIYQIDGGLQSYVNVRYLIPDQPNMKIMVTFALKRNPHDQNRIQPTDEDKVIWISAPYTEHPFCD